MSNTAPISKTVGCDTKPDTPIDITVIIPHYNRTAYIDDALDSIFAQRGDSFRIVEVLIVDDASTEDDASVALARAEARPGVRVIRLPVNSGPAAARNAGILEAKGNFLAFLDPDDVWTEGSLDRRARAMRETPAVGLVCGDFTTMDSNGANESLPFLQTRGRYKALCGTDNVSLPVVVQRAVEQLAEVSFISPCSVLVRADLVRLVGGFDERFRCCEDFHLFVRIAAVTNVSFCPFPCFRYRKHPSSITALYDFVIPPQIPVVRDLMSRAELEKYRPSLKRQLARLHAEHCVKLRARKKFGPAMYAALASFVCHPSYYSVRQLAGAALMRT